MTAINASDPLMYNGAVMTVITAGIPLMYSMYTCWHKRIAVPMIMHHMSANPMQCVDVSTQI